MEVERIRQYVLCRVISSLGLRTHAVIIAGMGRCGTTLLWTSLVQNHYYRKPPFAPRLEGTVFKNGFAYKTHDYPPESLEANVKVIYLFGNPMNIALSAHGMINKWGRNHHENMKSNEYKSHDDIMYHDSLFLGQHFDAWYRQHTFPFITLKYEAMHEARTVEALSDFMGYRVQLLAAKPRASDWKNSPYKNALLSTYGALDEKITAADPYKIWQP